jgi:hypothetical protein
VHLAKWDREKIKPDYFPPDTGRGNTPAEPVTTALVDPYRLGPTNALHPPREGAIRSEDPSFF